MEAQNENSHSLAQYTTLSRRFHDVMESYNSIQEDYRDKNKERIQRQLRICDSEWSQGCLWA